MAGKGGGAWKVAYADFVTAMMAFFMVMWIVAQSKPVKQAVAQYFKDPWKTSAKPTGNPSGGAPLLPAKKEGEASGPSLVPSARPGYAMSGQFQRTGPGIRGRGIGPGTANPPQEKKLPPGRRDTPSLYMIHKGDRQYVGTLLLFAEGSAELDDDSKERLKGLAQEIRGLKHKVEIRGHATRRPVAPGGPPQDAWALSYARCLATMKQLEKLGIEPSRFRLSQGGMYEPYSLEVTPAKLAYNSRVEVYMLGEYAEDFMGTPEERADRATKH
jgi:chemotaxis protein MotB